MRAPEILIDAFERIREVARAAVQGLDADQLSARLDPEANTIGWLVWHLTRVQDDHIAAVAGSEQVWVRDGWVDRFALPFDASAIGYGQTADEVAQVRVDGDLLAGYLQAVCDATVEWLATVDESQLDEVVDRRWDPPVTLAARLVSVVSDDLQHAGQAAIVRGVLLRTQDVN